MTDEIKRYLKRKWGVQHAIEEPVWRNNFETEFYSDLEYSLTEHLSKRLEKIAKNQGEAFNEEFIKRYFSSLDKEKLTKVIQKWRDSGEEFSLILKPSTVQTSLAEGGE